MALINAQQVDARGANLTQIHTTHINDGHHRENEAFAALRRSSTTDAQYNHCHRLCPPCDPGTRSEVLNKILNWIEEAGDHSICWLYGIAGSGKSAIAQSISERIGGEKLAASFFFDRQQTERCRKEYIITTIAYQLAISIPALKRPICDAIMKDETILNAVSAAKAYYRAPTVNPRL